MKKLLVLCFAFVFSTALAQETELSWPRDIEAGDNYTITLYQPQLETLKENKLDGRMALSIKDKKDKSQKIIFGALWFEARLSTDLESRKAVLKSIKIPKVKFPDIENEENIELLKSLIIKDFASVDIEMSIDNIISNLESVDTSQTLEGDLLNNAPEIYFRTESTVLVSIDGDPILKKVDNESLEYVVNTPFFIVKKNDIYYLKGEQTWYQSNAIVSNDWKVTKSVPKDVKKFADKNFNSEDQQQNKAENSDIPNIIVSTSQSELIVSKGELAYKPISNTSLLYVDNTESDIILEIESQTHYVLLNGRWYSTKTLSDGDWKFVEPNMIPESFKSIPSENSSISSVRSSIPGTVESKEAMYEQYIPQTAVVDKKTASAKVEYDGNPKFEAIDKTSMKYAVNTESTVLLINNKYYVIDEGVWFESNSANGPWTVSDKRPEEVKDIPPSSPVYNVKYVYIYESTPEVVYVGYTPGYYHSYVYGGVVVYGTGYYYRPWYGHYYYPRPVTYGFGVHYNPYTGWGFSVGVSYGWMTLSFHSHGYWGPAGYRHGYRHGYHNGYHRGYHNGYAAGYARGRYDSNNVYRRSDGSPRNGVTTRRESLANRRNAGSRSQSTNNRLKSSSREKNNVFADKNGNIHQRDSKGNWQQKRNSSTTKRPTTTDRAKKPNINRNQTPSTNRNINKSQLERQYNNRSRGNTKSRNYSTNRSTRGTRQSLPKRRGRG